MTAAAPVQVGIFTNDLCISFRIIMHELLDTHVFRVFDAAKEIHQTRTQDNFRVMYERGMKTVNAWDAQMKERYRAQIIGQYRQLTDLYHHIYLMYVQEMYDQSLDDVTVRVNIPALATMLHMFLKLACNHHVILSGEYVSTMNFAGRVLFVETIIRRLLYELLVQQNNIKSISTATGPARRNAPTAKAISVHSEEDVFSADMMVGTPRQATPKRLSPVKGTEVADSDRFWMAPTGKTGNTTNGSNNSILAVLGPGYKSETPQKLANLIPPLGTTSPSRSSPTPSNVLVVNSPAGSPVNSAVNNNNNSAASNNNNSAASNNNNSAASAAGNTSAASTSAANVEVTKKEVSPAASALSVSTVMPPSPADTILTGAKIPPVELIPKNTPRITSLPNQPVISGTQISVEQQKPPEAPLFELKSQFTPFKPGGTSLPDANVSTVNRKDIDVDSLQLQPSDQDFAEEARLLLQANNDTLTPFDSVTNIANGDRRPPLFFDPVRAI